MLSRWYSIFLGIILIIMGIAGLVAPRFVSGPGTTGTLVGTSIVWLITAVLALWFGFGVRNVRNVRWFAGIVGVIYLLWGIISMISAGRYAGLNAGGVLATTSGLEVLFGALGLAASLVPAYWLHEEGMFMPERA